MTAYNRKTALWAELTFGNHYAILGVPPKATPGEIKAAYHCAAMKCHPDLNNNSEESHRKFLRIKKAYDILSDPLLRSKYDQELAQKWLVYLNTNQETSTTKSQRESESRVSSIPYLIAIGMVVGVAWLLSTCSSDDSRDRDFSNALPQKPRTLTAESNTKTTQPKEYWETWEPTNGKTSIATTSAKSSETAEINKASISLSTGAKPYISTYGNGRYDSESLSFVEVKNGAVTDAIVMLYDINNSRIIRHAYIQAGSTYKLSKLPSGIYDLRVYSGNDWNSAKHNGVDFPKGGFNVSESYSQCQPVDYLNMRHVEQSTGTSYPTYSVTLYKTRHGNLDMRESTVGDFFL